MFFLALVVVPATRGLPPAERASLFGSVGRRFRTVGWVCIGVLIVTGTINTAYRGVTWENLFTAELWSSAFGTTLALKLGVVAVMLALSVYHDFVIGPRSVRILERATLAFTPDVLAEAQRLRPCLRRRTSRCHPRTDCGGAGDHAGARSPVAPVIVQR